MIGIVISVIIRIIVGGLSVISVRIRGTSCVSLIILVRWCPMPRIRMSIRLIAVL
jgi:hypothetical protein